MIEWLLTIGAAELAEKLFEEVLNLGKKAAENYVQDFFKDNLKEEVIAANPEVTKKAIAEALRAFLVLVVEELEFQQMSKSEIRDKKFNKVIVQFIKDDSIRSILSKGFDRKSGNIEVERLALIWRGSTYKGKPFPEMPNEFDWQRVGKEYIRKVRKIVWKTPELRALLETDLLETIAYNTGQLSPGFDLKKYKESLIGNYAYLKLYQLDNTDRTDSIKLWNVFIEQSVREALPPLRYEVPADLRRKLLENGQIDKDLTPEGIIAYRLEYLRQPPQKVLDALSKINRVVILGDPGAGKSTLLQYLALEWIENNTNLLPILIELREYGISSSTNFLEFLHQARGVDWQLDQQALHQHLQNEATIVMFDGLDEVFDRAIQVTVINDIIRFSRLYPKAKILVTTRIIGYNPEYFKHADFRHLTLQPFDDNEIESFISKWYNLATKNENERILLVQRLLEAIQHSKSIRNLADNPLLLTMMAILNRRQELPNDRTDLYDQASRVLLYHWDIDHKRLNIPIETIGRREKQDILRIVAYEMQTSSEKLQGNFILVDRLTQILTNYLRNQGFNDPREKANVLIQQLRERNFILCYRGADLYSFVHRTFLEYFCALEVVTQFEKVQSLTFKELRNDFFGKYWRDETWNEILRLICGMLNEKFALEIVDYLLDQESDKTNYEGGMTNILLASECFSEIKNQSNVLNIYYKILDLAFSKRGRGYSWGAPSSKNNAIEITYHSNISKALLAAIKSWKNDAQTLSWIEKKIEICIESDDRSGGDPAGALFQNYVQIKRKNNNISSFLKSSIENSPSQIIRSTALCELIKQIDDLEDPFVLMKKFAIHNKDYFVRWISIRELARIWDNDERVFDLLQYCAIHDPYFRDQHGRRQGVPNPRSTSIYCLGKYFSKEPETLEILKDRAVNDPDSWVRCRALRDLSNIWDDQKAMKDFFVNRAINDPFVREPSIEEDNPRQIALETLLSVFHDTSEILMLLQDRSARDPDEQLKNWINTQLGNENTEP